MKFPLLTVAVLIAFNISSVSYACNTATDPKCTNGSSVTLIDKVVFDSLGVYDATGSPEPGGVLNTTFTGQETGFGGSTVNILANTGDYVNWTHNFIFNPPVDAGGIFKASLNISLIDFKTNLHNYDESVSEHDDSHYESDGRGGSKEREHKKGDDGKDKEEHYSVDLSCLHEDTSSGSSAAIWMDGFGTKWVNIKSIDDSTATKFSVGFAELYDGSLAVRLKSTLNDFEIEWSRLDIEYCPAPVPEPSTILLFGAGLIGVGLLRKRMRK